MGKLLNIYTCPEKGMPMISLQEVWAYAGAGLKGDRYTLGKGAFSRERSTIRHVSLIAIEKINAANAELHVPFLPEETRRNLVTVGIDLDSLVGMRFRIGPVEMRWVEECTPCDRPNKLAGKSGFKDAYANCGGLRAEIFNDGWIRVGDEISIVE